MIQVKYCFLLVQFCGIGPAGLIAQVLKLTVTCIFIYRNHNDSTTETVVIPGSGKLAPNASYEILSIPRARAQAIETERNPAYVTSSQIHRSVANFEVLAS